MNGIVEYFADYIIKFQMWDNWRNQDLGEILADAVELGGKFDLEDKEYRMLADGLSDWLDDALGYDIDALVEKKLKENADENYDNLVDRERLTGTMQ